MRAIELQDPRRNRAQLDGLVDSGESDHIVFGHVNDDAATGQVSDDFIFRSFILRRSGRKQGDSSEKHDLR